MNNEEKILEILAAMQSDIAGLKQGQERLEQRQERLEQRQNEMQETLARVAVTQEGVVLPRLQAIYEGHGAIMERLDMLADKSRVEVLEDDVAMLKDSAKLLRMEVNNLKRA